MPVKVPNVPNAVQELSGTERQLSPDELQIVDGEAQTITRDPMPLIDISEPERREPPGPSSPFAPGIDSMPGAPGVPGGPTLFPVVRITRYKSNDAAFAPLLSWDIPQGFWGDLKTIAIKSSNDTITRYRVMIAGADMQFPLDRPTSTPVDFDWNVNSIPGPATVSLEVLSTTGAIITVDASITGVLKTQPV
jgi:hypothetical protein